MRQLTVGSLFAGIGGIDLGFERAGFTTKWQVEIDPYCQKVLAKNFPHAERYADVRECGAHNLSPVDVVVGGFPCQDISNAGKRAGITGARSRLWSEYARIVRELRPSFVFVENVAALLGRGIGTVLGDLAEIGYDAEWDCIPAAAVGADHLRDRVWLVAYPNSARVQPFYECWRQQREKEMGENAAYRHGSRLPRWVQAGEDGEDAGDIGARPRPALGPATPFPRLDRAGAPVLGRGEDGIPDRVDRMHAIGNAVVPQIPEIFARRIAVALEA